MVRLVVNSVRELVPKQSKLAEQIRKSVANFNRVNEKKFDKSVLSKLKDELKLFDLPVSKNLNTETMPIKVNCRNYFDLPLF